MRYEQVWGAVDKLAKISGLSPSGLAKKAGLDATTFNKSKRIRPDGNKRFPSLESLNKIVSVCNISFEQFYKLAEETVEDSDSNSIPYTRLSSMNNNSLDKNGKIDTSKWSKIKYPDNKHNTYAIEIDFEISNIYNSGSTIIVSKNSEIRRKDKVVIVHENNKQTIGEFLRRTSSSIEVIDDKSQENLILPIKNIILVNRILWVSQ